MTSSSARFARTRPAASLAEAMVQAGSSPLSAGSVSKPGSSDAQSVFSSARLDVTKMKVQLMERVGQAFGYDLEDFDSMKSLAEAIEGDILTYRMDDRTIAAIEKELGLDKLGVSLADVLDAMKDPGGSGDDRLEAALLEDRGISANEASATPPPVDGIGLYSNTLA